MCLSLFWFARSQSGATARVQTLAANSQQQAAPLSHHARTEVFSGRSSDLKAHTGLNTGYTYGDGLLFVLEQCLGITPVAFVLPYRCASVPDLHRIPFSDGFCTVHQIGIPYLVQFVQ